MSDVFPTAPPPTVTRLERDAVPAEVVDRLRAGAIVAPADVGVLDLTDPSGGPGAITCFQGLLTNDIEKAGDGAFVYGALLTPKGMIVVDGWAARLGSRVRFSVAMEGRERALLILQRSVPPRLARSVDRTSELAVMRVAGAHAVAVVGATGLPVPHVSNHAVDGVVAGVPVEVARTSDVAPFVFQVTTARDQLDAIKNRLIGAGAHAASSEALELARMLAGWPRLASEVDEKTIPQEVRFDEIGGVSYTKGCYTGQETVSRLHFRGHANRQLRGLLFEADPPAAPATGWSAVTHEERDVGRVTSIAWLPDGGGSVLGRWIGLAMLRREVEIGATVRAAGREARVTDLPFDAPRVTPA
ncbi:MAG TPA: glycine cleavage T C-terminal barrel domain-containing protein [Gemmatimonadales bacterium]